MKIRVVFILLLFISCNSHKVEDFSEEEVIAERFLIDNFIFEVLPKASDIFGRSCV